MIEPLAIVELLFTVTLPLPIFDAYCIEDEFALMFVVPPNSKLPLIVAAAGNVVLLATKFILPLNKALPNILIPAVAFSALSVGDNPKVIVPPIRILWLTADADELTGPFQVNGACCVCENMLPFIDGDHAILPLICGTEAPAVKMLLAPPTYLLNPAVAAAGLVNMLLLPLTIVSAAVLLFLNIKFTLFKFDEDDTCNIDAVVELNPDGVKNKLPEYVEKSIPPFVELPSPALKYNPLNCVILPVV
jgi:hypothetical protein